MKKILKGSPYYFEEVKGLDLEKRAQEGNLSYLLLNQPPRCDYRCKRCFMPDYRRRSYDWQKVLTIPEYRKIINDASDNLIMQLEISGEGEPLFPSSLNVHTLVSYANHGGISTTLITNGNNIDSGDIRFFEWMDTTLIFSLHTLNKERYESDNHVEGSFDKKMKNIEIAQKVYKSPEIRDNHEIYRLAIHATLQKDNLDEVGALKKFCEERGIFFSIAPLALIGNAVNHPEINPRHADNAIDRVVLKGHNSIIHSHSSVKSLGREVCGTAFYGLNIGWDGAILFDAHYGYEVGEKNLLGNIRDIPFEVAVKNQRSYIISLFESIDGSCPARDPKGKEYLDRYLRTEDPGGSLEGRS